MVRVSFDFDDTLLQLGFDVENHEFFPVGPNEEMLDVMKKHIAQNDDVFIITSRKWSESSENEIRRFLQKANLLQSVKKNSSYRNR